MLRKTGLFLMLILGAVSGASAQIDTSDSLTITTYYPSPYGVYGTLRLYPKLRKATCNEGEIVYHFDPTKPFTKGLYYCNQTSPSNWLSIATGGGGVPDPLVISRMVIGDYNNDGLFDAADIPPNSRPLYVQDQVRPSLFTAAFVNNLDYGVAVGPPSDWTVGAIQSNHFTNGGGDTPVTVGLTINPNGGNVGIGTNNPLALLHVGGTALIGSPDPSNLPGETGRIRWDPIYFGATQDALIIEKTDDDPWVGGGIVLGFSTSTGGNTHFDQPGWAVNHVPVIVMRQIPAALGGEYRVGINTLNPQGTLDVNGTIYLKGGLLHSDYVFDPQYKLESIAEHSDFMWKNKHLKGIAKAPKDESGLEVIELGAHNRGILEELEKAHIYIAELDQRLNNQAEELKALKAEIKRLKH